MAIDDNSAHIIKELKLLNADSLLQQNLTINVIIMLIIGKLKPRETAY